MKKITTLFFCLLTANVNAGSLPEIFVTEVAIAGGGIYTVTINQPPSPPGPIWSMTAWGVSNGTAGFAETMLTGWAAGTFDQASWDSGIPFQTDTPDFPIPLFTSGIAEVSDFQTLFGIGSFQAVVYWNESYFGNPLVATSSNFNWFAINRAPAAGGQLAFVVISGSDGQNLICSMGNGQSEPLTCSAIGDPDEDGDDVPDTFDNCTLVANPNQEDADFDGYGNACDPDLNNDEIVNFLDLSLFANVFLTNDEVADFNSDGIVNFVDLSIMSGYFFQPPGPSGSF